MNRLSKAERIFVYISPLILIAVTLIALFINDQYIEHRNKELTKEYVDVVNDLNKKITEKASKTFKNATENTQNEQTTNEQTINENTQTEQNNSTQQSNTNEQFENNLQQQSKFLEQQQQQQNEEMLRRHRKNIQNQGVEQ